MHSTRTIKPVLWKKSISGSNLTNCAIFELIKSATPVVGGVSGNEGRTVAFQAQSRDLPVAIEATVRQDRVRREPHACDGREANPNCSKALFNESVPARPKPTPTICNAKARSSMLSHAQRQRGGPIAHVKEFKRRAGLSSLRCGCTVALPNPRRVALNADWYQIGIWGKGV